MIELIVVPYFHEHEMDRKFVSRNNVDLFSSRGRLIIIIYSQYSLIKISKYYNACVRVCVMYAIMYTAIKRVLHSLCFSYLINIK